MKYEYETVAIDYSIWTGRAKQDFLEIINERGSRGWKFKGFAPTTARPKGVKGQEMIFEKELNE